MTRCIKGLRCTHTIQKIIHDHHNTGRYSSSGNGGPIRHYSTLRGPCMTSPPWRLCTPLMATLDPAGTQLWPKSNVLLNIITRRTWRMMSFLCQTSFGPDSLLDLTRPATPVPSAMTVQHRHGPARLLSRYSPQAFSGSLLGSAVRTTFYLPSTADLPFSTANLLLSFPQPSNRPTRTLTPPPVHVIPRTNHPW